MYTLQAVQWAFKTTKKAITFLIIKGYRYRNKAVAAQKKKQTEEKANVVAAVWGTESNAVLYPNSSKYTVI